MKIILVILLLLTVALCFAEYTDTQKASILTSVQNLTKQMYAGNPAAYAAIDWTVFNSFGTDIGAQYDTLKTANEKLKLQAGVLVDFKVNLDDLGIEPSKLSNWEINSETDTYFIINAECNNFLLWFSFSKTGNGYLLYKIEDEDLMDNEDY